MIAGLKKGWRPLVAILLFIFIWEFAVRLLKIEAWLLPTPTNIVVEFVAVWESFLPHVGSTIQLAIGGLLIGAITGLGVAMLLHLFAPIRETFYPFIILSQNIPIIVLAPLLVIWFGFGALPKLIVITLACFFPVAVATLDGLQQTNRDLSMYMQMMGATKSQMFFKLELPHAVPQIMSGMKIAATYSVMAAVISEWLGAQEGIVVYMTLAVSSYKTARVFVAIIVTMILSLTLFGVIVWIEKMLVRWQKKGSSS